MTATETKPQPIVLDLELHDTQLEVWNSTARYKVVACGRRWGKTFLGVNILLAAAGSKPRSINWWVAPRYDQTDVALRFFTEALPSELYSMNHTKKAARLWNGSIVVFKTADDPDALRSEGLDFVVLDEAAFQKEAVWPEAIRPALADKKGSALLIGTFDGENWFYDMYQRGQDRVHPEWDSWRFPSSANPFLDPEEIETARRETERGRFEQEWLANPLVYVGAVFDGEQVQAAADRGYAANYREDLPTYAGLDWGYTNETALEVCQEDVEGRITWLEEHTWQATELNERCKAIVDVVKRLGIEVIYADAAGASEKRTLANHLHEAGLKTLVQGVPFGKFKEDGIKTRRYYLERGLESLSPKCPKLIRDSKRYRYREGTEDVLKKDDHTVDAATAFYASRRGALVRSRN